LLDLPAGQRKIVKIFCPDYTERGVEKALVKNPGLQLKGSHYFFVPAEIHNRIQFSKFGDNYRRILPIQGTMPGYGFIKLQLHGVRPATFLHASAQEIIWIHEAPERR